MADANLDKKSNKDGSKEAELEHLESASPWDEQPSVLAGSRFKIGDNEEDYVD